MISAAESAAVTEFSHEINLLNANTVEIPVK